MEDALDRLAGALESINHPHQPQRISMNFVMNQEPDRRQLWAHQDVTFSLESGMDGG
jgi:hypothetical protein